MFRHIVVPVDFTEHNQQALTIAIDLAGIDRKVASDPKVGHDPNKVSILHVIELIQGVEFAEFQDFYAKLLQQAEEQMDTLLARYRNPTVELEAKILFGNRTSEILNYVRQNNASLIVMASHRLDPDQPAQGWGTLSHKIGILAECPVLLVK